MEGFTALDMALRQAFGFCLGANRGKGHLNYERSWELGNNYGTGLLWSQVDVARRVAWIHPDQAKARKAIAVPLNTEAVSLISKQPGTHATHVFT